MRRGDRLFEIIEILRRARGPISAEAIGAELQVTKRTVYRDIAALMAQGVPIRGEAGVGYILEDGFHMPPLMLTQDEVEAVLLGAQWVQTRGEPTLAQAANSLLAKIEAIVPADLQTAFVEPPVRVAPTVQPDEGLDAADIRRAIKDHRKIWLRYRDSHGADTARVVWPVLLGYRDAGRILAAWCELRGGFRFFRTERILDATCLEDRIPQRRDLLVADWRAAMAAERQRFQEGKID